MTRQFHPARPPRQCALAGPARTSCAAVNPTPALARAVGEYLPTHPVLRDVETSRVALLAREADTWVPKLKGGSEFWEAGLYKSTS